MRGFAEAAVVELGTVVVTPGALELRRDFLMLCLWRHSHGDWGVCCDEDKSTNNEALVHGSRLMSAYAIDETKPSKGYGDNTLWIITESDRSSTTLLLPEEY